jgi:glycosyltransferase involved in cell wall biosynthesis
VSSEPGSPRHPSASRPVKLVIQIPCLNEEATLPATLADLPRRVPGVDVIEVLVIDDGSRDRTGQVALAHGVHRVVRLPARQGLARAFARGLEEALDMGADAIVNTDADNQYAGADIGRLVAPILEGRADIVVGVREIDAIPHFSPLKKLLQKIGSWAVRQLSNTAVPDATSGFRAYSREAAMRLTVVSRFTYTLETLIQATQKHLTITHVPIRTNAKTRDSRLFKSTFGYVKRSIGTMAHIYLLYQPLRIFLGLSGAFLLASAVLFVRWFYLYFTTPGPTGHVQSLVVAGALGLMGFLLGILGILSDLTAMNRRLVEEVLLNTRRLRFARPTGGATQPGEPHRSEPEFEEENA